MNAPETTVAEPSRIRRVLLAVVALAIATLVWLPTVHLCFRPAPIPLAETAPVAALADPLAARHLELWSRSETRQAQIERMRASNAEWDFMARSFLAWAMANMALRDPDSQCPYLELIDRILDETVKLEQERGFHHFLMPYSRQGAYRQQPARSLFVDSEIALMMGLRRLVEEKEAYREPLRRRIDLLVQRMQSGPVLCAESYPDECWTFDQTVALAAIRVADRLDGTDHGEFFRRWLATAREKLTHSETGLLVSSLTHDGHPLDGPEGSTLWMASHMLQVIDPEFARTQYEAARRELRREVCGFGFAREWPASWRSPADIDSGPVIPLLDVSAGSSGLAFVGARTFDDADYFRTLWTTLNFSAFPVREQGRLRYCASNEVGDAVLLYAAVLGPAWKKVREGTSR